MSAARPHRPSLAELVQGIIGSPSISTSVAIGVTGHRHLEAATKRWVELQLDGLFGLLTAAQPAVAAQRAFCSLAIGADQLFAEAAHRHRIPLEVIIPFTGFIEDFTEETERGTYQRLRSAAAATTHLPWQQRSDGAYLAAGVWVVDHSDLLIAVWNGEKAAGVGGTGDVVDYARHTGKPGILFNPARRSITRL